MASGERGHHQGMKQKNADIFVPVGNYSERGPQTSWGKLASTHGKFVLLLFMRVLKIRKANLGPAEKRSFSAGSSSYRKENERKPDG